jgi:short-subunit dehydrogenase
MLEMVKQGHNTALITGATSGIGKSIAVLLAKKGYNLICAGRNKERMILLEKELKACAGFYSYKCDLTVESELLDFVKRVNSDFEKIEILIHAAGCINPASVIDSKLEDYNFHFNLNTKAPILITKMLLEKLKDNNGQIVFVNSSAVQRAIPNLSLYTASKLALKGFADSLRQEVNQYGIKVISVYPGQTATPMQQKLYETENKNYNPEKLLQAMDVASAIVITLELPATAEVTDLYIRPSVSN